MFYYDPRSLNGSRYRGVAILNINRLTVSDAGFQSIHQIRYPENAYAHYWNRRAIQGTATHGIGRLPDQVFPPPVGALGPFVVRRILGTELFERRRQYLFEDGLLTPDLMRFLRTMAPSEQYTRENRIAAQDWENYFGELGREARDRVDRII